MSGSCTMLRSCSLNRARLRRRKEETRGTTDCCKIELGTRIRCMSIVFDGTEQIVFARLPLLIRQYQYS